MSTRFIVRQVCDENFRVWDQLFDLEMCLCSGYEGELHSPQERAKAIADLLNASNDFFMRFTMSDMF